MTKGVFVYIDHSNLLRNLHVLGYKNMDWAALMNWFTTKQNVTRVYIYGGYATAAEKAEFEKLEKLGYKVDIKKVMQYPDETTKHRLKCPACSKTHTYSIRHAGKRKANCDAELTMDAINDGARHKYSGVIVFSGDGDFGRVYTYISKTLEKPVTVFSPMGSKAGKRTSTHIKQLHKEGVIKLNALEGILGTTGYGIKKK
jgi:uncharacterized LabA/DUF88 family protein